MPDLAVRRLTLNNFRCYQQLRLEPQAGFIALIGPNGAGKTNILEALSLLTPGRGLRRAKLIEMAKYDGAGDWAVAAKVQVGTELVDIGTGIEASLAVSEDDSENTDENRVKRISRINGQNASSNHVFAEYISALWLTPQMDRLFVEGAGNRRRFFDRLVFATDPDHGRRSSAYEQTMRERLRLLKMGTRQDQWLNALEASMAAEGTAIAATRRQHIEQLVAVMPEAAGPFPQADLTMSGEIDQWLEAMPALQVEDKFREQLRQNRGRDAEAGMTTLGPHRSDFSVVHRQKKLPAPTCSTGEQKALLISLILASALLVKKNRNHGPLMLLDEMGAHLDSGKRAALSEALDRLCAQTWVTGTDRMIFSAMEGKADFFAVEDGAIRQF